MPSSSTAQQIIVAQPELELEQPLHKSEIIIRLYDESARKEKQVICTVFRILKDASGKETSMKLDDVILNKIHPQSGVYNYRFIGIFSSSVDLPHGTKVLVNYNGISFTITMFYH